MKLKRDKKIQSRQSRSPLANPKRAPVFSYHGQRNEQQNPEGKTVSKHKRPKQFFSLWHISIFLFIVVTLWLLTRLDGTPKFVFEQSTTKAAIRNPDIYKKAAEQILNSSPRNKNKLLFDRSGFVRQMKSQFPELNTIDVRVPLVGRLPVIAVSSVKPPVFILKNADDAYIVDASGRLIIPVAETPSSITDALITVNDQSGIKLKPGLHIIPVETVRFIQALQAQLVAKQVVVSGIDLPVAAQEAHVRIAGQGYYIKFATDSNVRQQAGTFLAVKQKLEKDKITPREYIDVRVEEKAFYK